MFAASREGHARHRRAERADARVPDPGVRRRGRPRPPPPVHVGAQAALLRLALLQLAVHVRAAVRPRSLRRVPGRPRTLPRRLRRPAVPRRHGHRRGARVPRSASTSPTRRSGRRASTSAATASPSTSSSPPTSETATPCRCTTRYDVSREELTELLDGTPRYRVDQVWSGLYEQFTDPDGLDQPAQGDAGRSRRTAARARSGWSPSRSARAATRSSSSGNSRAAAVSRRC